MIEGLRKVSGAPLEIGEDPISIFPSYKLKAWLKKLVEIHRLLSCRSMCVKRGTKSSLFAVAVGGGEPCRQTAGAGDLSCVDVRWV
jgi:hypothetical protein